MIKNARTMLTRKRKSQHNRQKERQLPYGKKFLHRERNE